jgi:L-threonylcarbamoyladenylate synthase
LRDDVSADAARAITAIRAGEVVVLPTDTVYGLAVDGLRPEPVERLYRLKGRADTQPTALVVASVERLLDYLPELSGKSLAVVQTLLPGPYTLVLPNPGGAFRWLSGTRPEALGIRVPSLEVAAGAVLEATGALAMTSANHPGGRDPRSLSEVPRDLVEGAAAVVDGGRLPGIASTVIDLTGDDPVILRDGAVASTEVLALLRDL